MSFSKTISVFAALASIFGAGAAGWKLSQDNQTAIPQNQEIQTKYEERISELQQQVSGLQQQLTNVNPNPPNSVQLPQPSTLKPVQPPAASGCGPGRAPSGLRSLWLRRTPWSRPTATCFPTISTSTRKWKL